MLNISFFYYSSVLFISTRLPSLSPEIARVGRRSSPASVSIEIKPKEMDPSLFKMNFLYTKNTKETEATFLNTEKQRIKGDLKRLCQALKALYVNVI